MSLHQQHDKMLVFSFFSFLFSLNLTALETARDTTSEYIAWGHSTIVDPWGKIVSKANEGEETIVADLGILQIIKPI